MSVRELWEKNIEPLLLEGKDGYTIGAVESIRNKFFSEVKSEIKARLPKKRIHDVGYPYAGCYTEHKDDVEYNETLDKVDEVVEEVFE